MRKQKENKESSSKKETSKEKEIILKYSTFYFYFI